MNSGRFLSMWRKLATLTLSLLIPMAAACGPQVREDQPRATPAALRTPAAPVARPAPVPDLPVVVFLGDSLTAGLGLDEDQAYPAVLAQALREERLPIRAVNAGVSGDTT